jgi:DNA-binding NarL/FixJ family response regulator
MPSQSRYEISPSIAHREIEGQILLLTPDDDTILTLNGTGAFAWGLLSRGASADEIVRALAARYACPLERLAPDVDAFLSDLESHGIVRRIP